MYVYTRNIPQRNAQKSDTDARPLNRSKSKTGFHKFDFENLMMQNGPKTSPASF